MAIPATIERVDNKTSVRHPVTICGLSVTDVGIRHTVRMAIGEQFTIKFSGALQIRHAIRCIVTGCNPAKKSGGFIVGAAFLEPAIVCAQTA